MIGVARHGRAGLTQVNAAARCEWEPDGRSRRMEDTMGDAISLQLAEQPDIEVDGAMVAQGLGLGVERFRELMSTRRIRVLCERGTGEDAGLYRASFYHEGRRMRLVVDAKGRPVDPASPTRLHAR